MDVSDWVKTTLDGHHPVAPAWAAGWHWAAGGCGCVLLVALLIGAATVRRIHTHKCDPYGPALTVKALMFALALPCALMGTLSMLMADTGMDFAAHPIPLGEELGLAYDIGAYRVQPLAVDAYVRWVTGRSGAESRARQVLELDPGNELAHMVLNIHPAGRSASSEQPNGAKPSAPKE